MDKPRPLSPHIQVYRPQITSVLSIAHRTTGVVLSLGSLLFVAWLVAGSVGAEPYERIVGAMQSWFGVSFLFVLTFSAFFHLCNGVRHLFWDAVRGFELKTIYLSGWSVVLASMVLTVAAWTAGLMTWRGGP